MERKSFLIKNANIVSLNGNFLCNIFIQNEKIHTITDVNNVIKADETIDAKNAFVIPGCVDEHTHMMDPGYTEREDFTTGTRAAAYGGITTIITHHRTAPPVYSVKELREKIYYLKDKSVVDFALMGGGSPDNVDKLNDMWKSGVTGFKMFTCNLHEVKAMYPGYLFRTFTKLHEIGATALIHCEDDNITKLNEERLRKENRIDYLSQIEWRSAVAERVAVETVITIAKETRASVVIAHVSQPILLEKIKEARDQGYNIFAETCPQYLYLTIKDLEKKGPWVKYTPPMKTEKDIVRMWELFNNGDYVTTIGSDHCPYPKKIKEKGIKNIWDAPNGIPGVETSLRLMLNAVNSKKITLSKLVKLMCENPAKIWGLYPKKGTIQVGSDADINILDMEKEEILLNKNVISKCGWTPYDGMKIKGAPEIVIVRGNIVVKDGKVIGKKGFGKFVKRLGS